MHEYSIVGALIEQIESVAKQNAASKVTKVFVKIGVMSGVEAHLFEVAFETFKEGSVCDGAELVVQSGGLVIECNSCGSQCKLDAPHYLCSECGATDVRVIDGEDMYLMSLEMEEGENEKV